MGKDFFKVVALAIFLICSVRTYQAQTDERRFEVGGQYSFMNLAKAGSGAPVVDTSRRNESGFGGRIGYNFNRNFGIEAEGNFFPRNRELEGGRKIEGLVGAKVGARGEKFGVFGKARPGFLRLSAGDFEPISSGGCVAVFPPPIGCFQPKSKTNFAFDVGGIVEYYPTARTILRFDAGDTIVRYGDRNVPGLINSAFPIVVVRNPSETVHNLQASVGVGFRF